MNCAIKNVEVEKAIIACIFSESGTQDQIFSELTPEHFVNENAHSNFLACLEMYKKDMHINIAIANDRIDYVFVSNCISLYGHSYSKLDHYISTLKELAVKRKIYTELDQIRQNLVDKNTKIEEIGENISDVLAKINSSGSNSRVQRLADIIDTFGTEEAFRRSTEAGIKTGYQSFDNAIKLGKGNLITLGGRPAMGKTAFMLALAKNIAKHNNPALIISLEMKSEELLHRLSRSETDGSFSHETFSNGCKKIAHIPLYIDDNISYSLNKLRYNIISAKIKYKIEIVFIDYLQLIRVPKGHTRAIEIAELTRRLKELAMELEIPIFMLSQLNRNVENAEKEGYKPKLSDLRDGGSIEQDSDIVLFCYRAVEYGFDVGTNGADITNLLEIIISKNRNGRTGNLPFNFDRKTQNIIEFEKESNMMPRKSRAKPSSRRK